jgi:hypothetical protein
MVRDLHVRRRLLGSFRSDRLSGWDARFASRVSWVKPHENRLRLPVN